MTARAACRLSFARQTRSWYRLGAVLAGFAGMIVSLQGSEPGLAASQAARASDPAVVTVYPSDRPRGVMVTSGGWAYCYQVRRLARRTRFTLLCGRFSKDGYVSFGLRARRHVDWGNPAYLASFARKIRTLHERVGGNLVLIGVSYSGFGVATLASHHPEIRPNRLIAIDSYLDLVARRSAEPDRSQNAQEIDGETGGSTTELRSRSVSVEGLVRLVRTGTRLTEIWSISDAERRRYRGATCNRAANAQTLSRLAAALGRPVSAWVTENRHGTDLWHFGQGIIAGRNPGRKVVFRPDGMIPDSSVC
jgi:pimeloyl-ACP methyl ester carboxylesterase